MRYQDFAARLEHTLRSDDIPPELVAELKRYIGELPLGKSAIVTASFEELDNCGTALWNFALRMKRQDATVEQQNTFSLGIAIAMYLTGTSW